MQEYHARTQLLLGTEGLRRLATSRVAVVGLGGVGGHCTEALARAGVGSLLLIDSDTVEQSNLNRQLAGTKQTLGMPKTEAMRARIEAVSDCRVETHCAFLLEDTVDALLNGQLDYIVDAVDTVAAKLAIAQWADLRAIPHVACMGMGNRLDPSAIAMQSLSETTDCPLARAMRKGCRERGISLAFPVAVSRETPLSPMREMPVTDSRAARTPGSAPFVPAAAGLLLASFVVRSLIGLNQPK